MRYKSVSDGNGVTVDVSKGPREWRIQFISANTPGNGDVGKFLDSLPSNKKIVFENVISSRLAGMLERRNYVAKGWDAASTSSVVPDMLRRQGFNVDKDVLFQGRPRHWVRPRLSHKELQIGMEL